MNTSLRIIAGILVILLATAAHALPVSDGLIIHLEAENLSLGNGEAVTTWPDSATSDSVNGTLYAVPGYGVPELRQSAINGLPAVRFTAPGDPGTAPNSTLQVLSSGTWSWDNSQGVTVFLVCTGGREDQVQRVIQIGKSSGDVFKVFGCDVNSSQSGADATGSGARFNNGWCCTATAGANAVKRGEWHMSFRQIAQGGAYPSVYYRVNDVALVQTATNQPGRSIAFDAAGNNLTVGCGRLDGGGWAPMDWYDGDLAEVIIYNKQLTPSQIRQVSQYINDKYAIHPSDADRKFTVAVIPDSQGYPNHSNQPASTQLFRDEVKFIADSANSMNIVFATHEGDVVMTSNATQFNRAVSAMDYLKNTIPIAITPGNHDYDSGKPITGATDWNKYFGPDTDYFRDKAWFGGHAANGSDTDGMSTWQTFTAAGIDFLHIGFEVAPSDARLNWAKSIINAHPGWPTIITIHAWMHVGNGSYWDASLRSGFPRNTAQQIWDEFIAPNSQIFMVLCGHSFNGTYDCSYRREDLNNAGYPVYQLLADYQGTNSGANLGNGGGWIRLMEFDPVVNTVRVRTWSTILNRYSTHPTLTDGSDFARNRAAFNYNNEGAGSLYPESHPKAHEFTIPFIYGRQLPRTPETFGAHIAGRVASFALNTAGEWLPSGLAFDPTVKVDGNYDRLYYVNRVSSGGQGLYAASISGQTSGSRLRLGAHDNPYGCAVDAAGNAYVCYNNTPALWKVTDPHGSAELTQIIGNYAGTGDDDLQSVSMVPPGFGGGFEPGLDLVVVESGLDSDSNEAIVVFDSSSTVDSPAYSILWQDTSDFFSEDIKGYASDFDGYLYLAPGTIPIAKVSGQVRPYICRIKGDGVMQRVFLDADVTRSGVSPLCDDSIAVNPANGSVWLATAASTSQSDLYPRIVWRIDMRNAISLGGDDFLAPTTPEITSGWYNVGVNGMAWSPDGKYLAVVCPDSDKVYVYTSAMPVDCADAINKGYGLDGDYNGDCRINLLDVAAIEFQDLPSLVESWLDCVDPQTCDWLWP